MLVSYKEKLWDHWMPFSHFSVGLIVASIFINILALVFPITILQVYDRIVPNHAVETLVYLTIGVIVVLLIELGLKIARQTVILWSDTRLEYTLGCYGFHQLLQADLLEYEKESPGQHLDRLNAVAKIKEFYGGNAIISIIDVPFVFLFVGFLYYIGGILVIVPAMMLFIIAAVTYYTDSKTDEILKEKTKIGDRRTNFLVEIFTNIHTIKAYAMETLVLRRYERLQESFDKNDYKDNHVRGASKHIQQVLSQLNLVAVVVFGAYLVIKGQLTVGGLAACTLLTSRMAQPVTRIFGLLSKLSSARLAKAQLSKVLRMPTMYNAGEICTHLKGEIQLREVTFGYRNNDQLLFKNLNIHIKPGECLLLQGDEMSGRSSFLGLLAGLYSAKSGEVLIDGKPLSMFDNQSFRQQIAYITQDEALFEGTILDNLTLFQQGRYIDRAYEVANELGLDNIVSEMPDGYDTIIHFNSVDVLSRGLKQKIIIARALVHEPKIMLFDDANSAMDFAGNQYLSKYLASQKGSMTMVIVSHSPELEALADRKLYLQQGQLIEGKTSHVE